MTAAVTPTGLRALRGYAAIAVIGADTARHVLLAVALAWLQRSELLAAYGSMPKLRWGQPGRSRRRRNRRAARAEGQR